MSKIEIIKEKKGYSVCLPKYWIVTQGNTYEELINNINKALDLYYEDVWYYKSIETSLSKIWEKDDTIYSVNDIKNA